MSIIEEIKSLNGIGEYRTIVLENEKPFTSWRWRIRHPETGECIVNTGKIYMTKKQARTAAYKCLASLAH